MMRLTLGTFVLFMTTVDAFMLTVPGKPTTSSLNGQMETIEFRIYSDGRVEEKVVGVKGGNCNKITESINECLGKVVHSEATEELFENQVFIEETVSVSNESGGWEDTPSW